MGYVAKSGAFVDLDALPDEEASLTETLRFALGPDAESIRGLLLEEFESAADLLLRQAARKAQTGVFNLPLLGPLFSGTASLSVPIFVPTANGPKLVVASSRNSFVVNAECSTPRRPTTMISSTTEFMSARTAKQFMSVGQKCL